MNPTTDTSLVPSYMKQNPAHHGYRPKAQPRFVRPNLIFWHGGRSLRSPPCRKSRMGIHKNRFQITISHTETKQTISWCHHINNRFITFLKIISLCTEIIVISLRNEIIVKIDSCVISGYRRTLVLPHLTVLSHFFLAQPRFVRPNLISAQREPWWIVWWSRFQNGHRSEWVTKPILGS